MDNAWAVNKKVFPVMEGSCAIVIVIIDSVSSKSNISKQGLLKLRKLIMAASRTIINLKHL